MTQEDWKFRIETESRELDGKITKLKLFMATPEYEALDPTDRDLLSQQWNSMLVYSNLLHARLGRANRGE